MATVTKENPTQKRCPGCFQNVVSLALCRCSWAHTRLLLLVVLGGHVDHAWVLVNAYALGSQEGSRVRHHPSLA